MGHAINKAEIWHESWFPASTVIRCCAEPTKPAVSARQPRFSLRSHNRVRDMESPVNSGVHLAGNLMGSLPFSHTRCNGAYNFTDLCISLIRSCAIGQGMSHE